MAFGGGRGKGGRQGTSRGLDPGRDRGARRNGRRRRQRPADADPRRVRATLGLRPSHRRAPSGRRPAERRAPGDGRDARPRSCPRNRAAWLHHVPDLSLLGPRGSGRRPGRVPGSMARARDARSGHGGRPLGAERTTSNGRARGSPGHRFERRSKRPSKPASGPRSIGRSRSVAATSRRAVPGR